MPGTEASFSEQLHNSFLKRNHTRLEDWMILSTLIGCMSHKNLYFNGPQKINGYIKFQQLLNIIQRLSVEVERQICNLHSSIQSLQQPTNLIQENSHVLNIIYETVD